MPQGCEARVSAIRRAEEKHQAGLAAEEELLRFRAELEEVRSKCSRRFAEACFIHTLRRSVANNHFLTRCKISNTVSLPSLLSNSFGRSLPRGWGPQMVSLSFSSL